MSEQMNVETIAPQKNRTILELPILNELDGNNWLLVSSNNKTYRITAGLFSTILAGLAVDKEMLGLDRVDNTSDAEKPLSEAAIGALEAKSPIEHTHSIEDLEGARQFVEDILGETLEVRNYVRGDVFEVRLGHKVDKEELQQALDLKLNASVLNTLSTKTEVTEALALKADQDSLESLATKEELTEGLALKADKTELETLVSQATLDSAVASLATQADVNTALELKADKSVIEAALELKAVKTEVEEALDTKLNIEDFNNAVADIQAQKGDKGDPGEPGADGKDGVDGAPGVDGKDGEDGAPGVDGKSAYELAIDNGFVGTEVEWLSSLKGEKGEKGDPGEGGSGTGAAGSSKGIFDYKNLLLDSSLYCTINEIPAFSWDIIKTEPDYLKDYGDASAAETNPAIAQQFKLENNFISSSFIFFYGTPSEFTDTTEVRRLVPKFIDSNNFYKLAKEDTSLSFNVSYSYNVGTTLNLKMSFFDIAGTEISSVTSNMVDLFPITQEMVNDTSLLLGAIKKETTHISTIIPENAVYVKPEIIIYITPSQLELSKRCNMYISDFQLEANSEPTEFENNELIESLQKLTNLSTIEKMITYYYLDTDEDDNQVLDVKHHNKMILFDSTATKTLYVPDDLPDGFRCDIYTRGKVNVIGPNIKWKDNKPRAITEFAPMSITKMGSYRGYFAFGGEIVI